MTPRQKPSGYWTKERCQVESLKYQTRGEFQILSDSVYQISRRNKWLDDICSHMEEIKKPNRYWTKEKCQEEASKYNTKSEYNKKSKSAYGSSWKNGWLDEVCSHMIIYKNEIPKKNPT